MRYANLEELVKSEFGKSFEVYKSFEEIKEELARIYDERVLKDSPLRDAFFSLKEAFKGSSYIPFFAMDKERLEELKKKEDIAIFFVDPLSFSSNIGLAKEEKGFFENSGILVYYPDYSQLGCLIEAGKIKSHARAWEIVRNVVYELNEKLFKKRGKG